MTTYCLKLRNSNQWIGQRQFVDRPEHARTFEFHTLAIAFLIYGEYDLDAWDVEQQDDELKAAA